MNVAIIGAGLIGKKRAQALPKGVKLSIICDINKKKALELARQFDSKIETDWNKVVKDSKIQAIIIATVNKYLAPIAEAAILKGKHVLIEKPGARNLKELKKIKRAHKKRKVVVMFGYNHRFHPSVIRAKEITDSKKYGSILFVRAKYGHGGRLGYEREWRFNKDLAGGGELLDQGSHLIDLVNFFCGKMEDVIGLTSHLFWKSKLEDSAFFILSNRTGQLAQLSVSCVEWKNIFSLEIMLSKAKIQIDGLGGSYGRQKLTLYKMKPEMGPPDTEEILFNNDDKSWNKENRLFFDLIGRNDFSDTNIKNAEYVLGIIEKLYRRNFK